jgi:vitamin B12 transporter
MGSSTTSSRRGATPLCWFASTALATGLLPFYSLLASAQQTASPEVTTLPEVKVTAPPPSGRTGTRPARTAERPATPAPTSAPPTPEPPTAAGDPVVYSATGVVTPAREVTSSVTVINRQQLEQQQLRTAPDALSTVPGLNVVQTGSPGGQTSIFLRGTNSNHTKFIIDGMDVSDPSIFNRTFDLGQMLTGDVERIEVLRGPQSGLYGADAIGGVVSVITKKGEGPPTWSFTTEGGSFSTFNQRASFGGSGANYNYQFNVDHFHAGSVPATPLELLPPGQARINDYFDAKQYSTKLGANVSEYLTLNYVARYIDAKLKFTGDNFTGDPKPPPGAFSVPAAIQGNQVVHKFFTRGEAVLDPFNGQFVSYFGINWLDNWNQFFDPFGFPPLSKFKGERIRYDYRGDLKLAPNALLIFGASDETESFQQGALNKSSNLKGAFAELQADYQKTFFLVANARVDDDQFFGTHTTYRIAPAVIMPSTDTKFRASYGTGFKVPTLVQKFQDFPPTFFANPNLKPESSTGWDLGVEQPLWDKRALVGVTWFNNHITDLIESGPTGQFIEQCFDGECFKVPIRSNFNIGSARMHGIEAFGAVNVTDRIKLRADYTYTRAIDSDTGLELIRRPKHKWSLQGLWNPIDPLTLTATLVHVGDWIDGNRDFSVPRQVAPGFTVVNVAANFQVNPTLKTFARIDNLFNEHYQNPTGFLRPGIGIYGGMTYTGGVPRLPDFLTGG